MAVALGALPLLLAIGTCYLKFSIVLGMLRSGFGTQQTPSNALVVALSVVMSLIVMQPVISGVIERAESVKVSELSKAPLPKLLNQVREVISPWVDFLMRSAGEKELSVFAELTRVAPTDNKHSTANVSITDVAGRNVATSNNTTLNNTASNKTMSNKRMSNKMMSDKTGPNPEGPQHNVHTLPTIIGAFVVTEIKRGFLISFALLIPFFVIDLVVSNILVGMGLTMMSPVIVSLPIKVLIFISADGWLLLVQTLIQGYQS